MGVEGLRWLSQDKALGSGRTLLSFVSPCLLPPLSLSLSLHPKGLILQSVPSHAAACDNCSENQELKSRVIWFQKISENFTNFSGFFAHCLAALSHSCPCEVEQTFALLNDSYSSVLFSLSLTVGAL